MRTGKSAPSTASRGGARTSRVPHIAGVLAIACLAVAAGIAWLPPSAEAPETPERPRAQAPAVRSVSPLWDFVDRRATELEALWRPRRGIYVMAGGNRSTRLLASMLTIHAQAAIAGHTGPSRRDERIEPLARALSRYPAFVESSEHGTPFKQFHVPGWFANPGIFPSKQHVAIDAQVAESLQAAWGARNIVGISQAVRRSMRRAVGLTARSRYFRYPSIRLNQFNWNADLYAADAAINGRTRLLRRDYRRQLVRFLRFARRARPHGSSNLTAGFGLRYLPQNRPDSGANRMSSSEYGGAVIHGLEHYATALKAGMRPLGRRDARLMRRWARLALYGEWTHAGALNWDTGLGFARWQLTRYWSLALSGLSTLADAPVLTRHERAWARWMLERALSFYERYQAAESRGCMPSGLFGVRCTASIGEDDPLFAAARTAATVAPSAARERGRAPTGPPPSLYAFDPDTRRLALTTPVYSTAVIDQTFATGYGGVGLARLLDGLGRPLGSIGGRGRWGFGLSLHARGGGVLLDTLPGGRVGRSFHGPTRRLATFRAQVRVRARVVGRGGTTAEVRHRFTPASITTTYRLHGPRGGHAVLRLPVWARGRPAVRPATTANDGGMSIGVAQAAGGYTAVVRSAGTLSTRWRRTTTPSKRSPGTVGALDVIVRLRGGGTTITVALHPHRAQATVASARRAPAAR